MVSHAKATVIIYFIGITNKPPPSGMDDGGMGDDSYFTVPK